MSDHYDERPHPINCCQAFDDTCPSCFWWDCATKAAEARIVAWLKEQADILMNSDDVLDRAAGQELGQHSVSIEKGEHRERK